MEDVGGQGEAGARGLWVWLLTLFLLASTECSSRPEPRAWQHSPQRWDARRPHPTGFLSAFYVTTIRRRPQAPDQNGKPASRRSSWDAATAAQFHGSYTTTRAPQHGRINAENEPSPRHGTHGARPTELRQRHETTTQLPWPRHARD